MKKVAAAFAAASLIAAGVAATVTKKPESECVQAPNEGADCKRKAPRWKEARFFGVGNVFPRSEAVGSECEAAACAVFSSDGP